MATETDNVNSGALGTIVVLGTVAMLSVTMVVTALVRAETSDEMEKKDVGADRPYRDLVAEQTAKLSAPAAYVDRGKGLVSLPVERAMEVTVEGLKKDPNSATPPPAQGGTAATETGGTAATETGGGGGTSSVGGTTGASEGGEPKPAEEAKPAPVEEKKDEKGEAKKDEKKKEGQKPKPAPAVPAAPVAPTPAPAPAAPNGQ